MPTSPQLVHVAGKVFAVSLIRTSKPPFYDLVQEHSTIAASDGEIAGDLAAELANNVAKEIKEIILTKVLRLCIPEKMPNTTMNRWLTPPTSIIATPHLPGPKVRYRWGVLC